MRGGGGNVSCKFSALVGAWRAEVPKFVVRVQRVVVFLMRGKLEPQSEEEKGWEGRRLGAFGVEYM